MGIIYHLGVISYINVIIGKWKLNISQKNRVANKMSCTFYIPVLIRPRSYISCFWFLLCSDTFKLLVIVESTYWLAVLFWTPQKQMAHKSFIELSIYTSEHKTCQIFISHCVMCPTLHNARRKALFESQLQFVFHRKTMFRCVLFGVSRILL